MKTHLTLKIIQFDIIGQTNVKNDAHFWWDDIAYNSKQIWDFESSSIRYSYLARHR